MRVPGTSYSSIRSFSTAPTCHTCTWRVIRTIHNFVDIWYLSCENPQISYLLQVYLVLYCETTHWSQAYFPWSEQSRDNNDVCNVRICSLFCKLRPPNNAHFPWSHSRKQSNGSVGVYTAQQTGSPKTYRPARSSVGIKCTEYLKNIWLSTQPRDPKSPAHIFTSGSSQRWTPPW